MRATPLSDPVTGLPSRAQLRVDLGLLAEDLESGTRLLGLLTLEGLADLEREQGAASADQMLKALARRLHDALGGSGTAYCLDRDRFALLARPGRASAKTIVRAAAASLCEDRSGAEVFARSESILIAPGTSNATLVLPALEAEADAKALVDPERAVDTVDGDATAGRHTTRGAWLEHAGFGMSASGLTLLDRPEAPVIEIEEPPTLEGSAAIAAARRRDRRPSNPPPRRLPYLTVRVRFALSVALGLLWISLSAWIAWPWVEQLGRGISLPAAVVVVAGVALIPGYLNVQLVSSLLMDHPAPIDFDFSYPGITLLVAAYEEERNIALTLAYALDQDYPGNLRVILADDGSADATASVARGLARMDGRLSVLEVPHGGKANALNAALAQAYTPLVATIDADTLLMPNALRRIVARMLLCPPDTVAVAGSVLARNSRAGLLTRAQTWDYFLGIGSIKRQQALLQSTLVAQGAFSVYDREALSAAGGWPDKIGEDIVMTWALIANGGATSFEPTAVAFTEVPENLRHLARQRRRWARGMIEGLRSYGLALLRRRRPFAHSVAANMLFPYLDTMFTLVFLPGIVLACFGDFAIVGPMTLAVLPLNALLASIMYRRQRRSLSQAGLLVRRHLLGFVVYLLAYQFMMSPVSVAGYLEEILNTGRRW
jgi:biofilm PGA synthesis N-glycosyltransferase PgaC